MGQPVVHFEIMGNDASRLGSFYSAMFGWEVDANNPMAYGMVAREGNLNADGVGIGGGVGQLPGGQPGYVTVYVEVPDVGAALEQAERLGGQRAMGPETVMERIEIGLFTDPEGHLVGLVRNL
jgi:predicted enzyme related to lactoylglutathione lyase